MSSGMFGGLGDKISSIDPGRGGDTLLEAVGIPTLSGNGENSILDMGQTAQLAQAKQTADRAAKLQEAANASQQQQSDALNNIQRNFQSDLNTDNKGTVIAGGTADAVSADSIKRRRAGGVGIASSLGLNV